MPYSPAEEEELIAKQQEKLKQLQSVGPIPSPTPQPSHTIATVASKSINTQAGHPIESISSHTGIGTVPVVYFYIISKPQCGVGLPSYLIDTVSQAVNTQVCYIIIYSSLSYPILRIIISHTSYFYKYIIYKLYLMLISQIKTVSCYVTISFSRPPSISSVASIAVRVLVVMTLELDFLLRQH